MTSYTDIEKPPASAFDNPAFNNPAFNNPSAADQINRLIKDAIAVKSLLTDSVAAVRKVDSIAATQFSQSLEAVDKKYLDLMNESRLSAETLNGVITKFVELVVPVSAANDVPWPSKVKTIRLEIRNIETAAQKELGRYDEKLAQLKDEIKSLVDTLTKTSQNIKSESDAFMKEIETQIAAVTAKIKADSTTSGAKPNKQLEELFQSKPWPVGAVVDFVGSIVDLEPVASSVPTILNKVISILEFFRSPFADKHTEKEVEAKVNELASVKKEASDKIVEFDAATQEASKLAESFSGLDGRLGHFHGAWNMILADSKALGEYLTSIELEYDDQGLIRRLNSQAEVYLPLKNALDDYAKRLKV